MLAPIPFPLVLTGGSSGITDSSDMVDGDPMPSPSQVYNVSGVDGVAVNPRCLTVEAEVQLVMEAADDDGFLPRLG